MQTQKPTRAPLAQCEFTNLSASLPSESSATLSLRRRFSSSSCLSRAVSLVSCRYIWLSNFAAYSRGCRAAGQISAVLPPASYSDTFSGATARQGGASLCCRDVVRAERATSRVPFRPLQRIAGVTNVARVEELSSGSRQRGSRLRSRVSASSFARLVYCGPRLIELFV